MSTYDTEHGAIHAHPTGNPGDQPRTPRDVERPEGVRPGRHPDAERTDGRRGTAIALAIVLGVIALLLVLEVTAGTLTG